MTLTTFILTYLFGGLTFLPLLIAAIVAPAWLLLPRVGDEDVASDRLEDIPGHVDKDKARRPSQDAVLVQEQEQEEKYSPEGAASGTFAVLRSYNFHSATSSLNARTNSTANVAGGNHVSTDGSAEAGGESVYQTMYRSVFDRKGKTTVPGTSALENDEGTSTAGAGGGHTHQVKRKPTVGANVFYIVLRHGHLMLYDSSQQLEVRHVISLAHHHISLSEGEDGEVPIMESDLFIKRTAIVLAPSQHLPNGHLQPHSSAPKPFYLFSLTCSEKEDFYHALLNTTLTPPPIPQMLLPEDTIKLQSTLHSTSLTPETRAFNALVSRVFLGVHRTPYLENFIRSKIEKKIARVQKPAFIASLTVKSIDLGDAAPVLSNPRLKDLNISGDLTLGFDLRYTGGVKVVISAVAKLDLGTRFKTRTISLLLSTSLARLSAHMLFHIKPPPSNRIWFCFDSMPEMDIKVEPIVSQRQITYAFVLKAIEDRIRAVVAETLVKPNWDDVPFFDTRSQRLRGGIWADEGGEFEPDLTPPPKQEKRASVSSLAGTAAVLAAKNEKTMSMPTLHVGNEADSSGASSGSEHTSTLKPSPLASELSSTNLKRRSVVSLPLEAENSPSPPAHPPRPLRSPSFTSPPASVPSVALDDNTTVQPVRADDSSLQPKKWRSRPGHTQSRRDAVEAVREMRDRAAREAVTNTSNAAALASAETADDNGLNKDEDELNNLDAEDVQDDSRRRSDTSLAPSTHTTASRASSLRSPRRTDSSRSTTSSRSAASTLTNRSRQQQGTSQQQQQQQRGKPILAATAAAASAARTWGWNAIANRQKGSPIFRGGSPSQQPGATEQPIGRGQPLPPPGMPLPRPPGQQPRALWSNAGLGGGMRRKPLLPVRRGGQVAAGDAGGPAASKASEEELKGSEPEYEDVADSGLEHAGHEGLGDDVEAEDEFGPWRENSGSYYLEHEGQDAQDATLGQELEEDHEAELPDLSDQQVEHQEPLHEVQAEEPPPESKPKVPPPLPRRRKPVPPHASVSAPEEEHRAELAAPVIEQPEVHSPQRQASTNTDHGQSVQHHARVEDEGEVTGAADAAAESETQKKFLHGENVGEDDFEGDGPHAAGEGNGAGGAEEGHKDTAPHADAASKVTASTDDPSGLKTEEDHGTLDPVTDLDATVAHPQSGSHEGALAEEVHKHALAHDAGSPAVPGPAAPGPSEAKPDATKHEHDEEGEQLIDLS